MDMITRLKSYRNGVHGPFFLEVASELERLHKLTNSRLESIKAMSAFLDSVAENLGVPKPTTPSEGVGVCFEVIAAIAEIKADRDSLRMAIETLVCEEHRQVPDLHAQHEDLGGGCLFCLAQGKA